MRDLIQVDNLRPGSEFFQQDSPFLISYVRQGTKRNKVILPFILLNFTYVLVLHIKQSYIFICTTEFYLGLGLTDKTKSVLITAWYSHIHCIIVQQQSVIFKELPKLAVQHLSTYLELFPGVSRYRIWLMTLPEMGAG